MLPISPRLYFFAHIHLHSMPASLMRHPSRTKEAITFEAPNSNCVTIPITCQSWIPRDNGYAEVEDYSIDLCTDPLDLPSCPHIIRILGSQLEYKSCPSRYPRDLYRVFLQSVRAHHFVLSADERVG